MEISSRFFKLLLKIGNISFSEVVAPVECEQPKDGNVVPPKEPDHHGNRSQEAAASTTKGKRNRKSNVEKTLDVVFEKFKQASSEEFLR